MIRGAVQRAVGSLPTYPAALYLRACCRTSNFSPWLISACQLYVNAACGDSFPDIERSGELRVINDRIPRCKVAFDVGANIGEWSRAALKANSTLQLHCFEPGPAFDALSGLADRAKLNRVALGRTTELAIIRGPKHNTELWSLYDRNDSSGMPDFTESEIVNVSTIDDYCQENDIERIDYLKIDAEASEMAILQGAHVMLGRGAIGAIQFEFGAGMIQARTFLRDFFDLLEPLGYAMHRIRRHELSRMRYAPELEVFSYQNWLAVHPCAL